MRRVSAFQKEGLRTFLASSSEDVAVHAKTVVLSFEALTGTRCRHELRSGRDSPGDGIDVFGGSSATAQGFNACIGGQGFHRQKSLATRLSQKTCIRCKPPDLILEACMLLLVF